jgi:ketosteroid isomerase-like protein
MATGEYPTQRSVSVYSRSATRSPEVRRASNMGDDRLEVSVPVLRREIFGQRSGVCIGKDFTGYAVDRRIRCQAERRTMKDQQNQDQRCGARDQEIRAALNQHWAASDASDFETEHRIYHEDAVLEYPQSGERTRGRSNIQNQRATQPSKKRFAVRRMIGSGDLWVTEFILTYDGKPSYTVSIMEFEGDKVTRETQYFADPFVAPAWRAQWVERMDT